MALESFGADITNATIQVSSQVAPPTADPTAAPTADPTAAPTAEPTTAPSAEPTTAPSTAPSSEPTTAPSAEPTTAPTPTPTVAPTYGITVEAENGTVQYSPVAPEEGDTVTLDPIPNFGYQYVDGSLAVTSGETTIPVTDNTFEMPASDVVITAQFTQMEAADIITEATELSNGVTSDIAEMTDALTPEEGESFINEAQQANITAANEAKTALDNAVAAYGTEATEENLQAVIDAGQALVEASKNVVPYTVSWTIPQNTDSVTVTVNGAEIASGDSIYPASVVEVDVDAATGYYVRKLAYNGISFSGSFNMPAEDVAITCEAVKPTAGTGAGGWGGTGSGTTPTATPSATAGADVTPAPTEEQVFTDVPSSYWGYEYIMDLYDAGIVNGYEDGTFLPDNTVTRAEFTKMAVELFGLTNTATTSAFLDCTASDWYTPYVIAASEAGIVTGVSDEWFDANNTITREDICTIVGRYLNLSSNSASSFTDSADIADYAAGYVAGMVEAGYLTGYEDGTFQPKNNATRAEAAAILARVMNADEAEATASPEATADAEATAAPETTASPEATADAEATASPEATATADAE
ncbi:MAG TPA: S-layer homology domain-containing protein [Firmicutes bacterium]|nr:S-layer homology domain-containing protein [Bacillota bacterium]